MGACGMSTYGYDMPVSAFLHETGDSQDSPDSGGRAAQSGMLTREVFEKGRDSLNR